MGGRTERQQAFDMFLVHVVGADDVIYRERSMSHLVRKYFWTNDPLDGPDGSEIFARRVVDTFRDMARADVMLMGHRRGIDDRMGMPFFEAEVMATPGSMGQVRKYMTRWCGEHGMDWSEAWREARDLLDDVRMGSY